MAKAEMTSAEREKQYQIEDDARTLQRAQEIMADQKRFNAATKEIKKMRDALDNALLMKRYPSMEAK